MKKIGIRTYTYRGRTIYKGDDTYARCYFSRNEDGTYVVTWTQEEMVQTLRTGVPHNGQCWVDYIPYSEEGFQGMIP